MSLLCLVDCTELEVRSFWLPFDIEYRSKGCSPYLAHIFRRGRLDQEGRKVDVLTLTLETHIGYGSHTNLWLPKAVGNKGKKRKVNTRRGTSVIRQFL